MSLEATNYVPFNGDQITGSPHLLSQYISTILAKGAHFQFIDGETLEVIVADAGQAIVTSFGDMVVAPKPEALVEHKIEVLEDGSIDVVPALTEEAKELAEDKNSSNQSGGSFEELSPAEDLAAVEEPVVEAPAPKTRGRKPAVKTEAVEGE